MILPTKHLKQDRALLTVGARILSLLQEPKTVSAIWEELLSTNTAQHHQKPLRYDHFVLAIDLLYLMSAIEMNEGHLSRAEP